MCEGHGSGTPSESEVWVQKYSLYRLSFLKYKRYDMHSSAQDIQLDLNKCHTYGLFNAVSFLSEINE